MVLFNLLAKLTLNKAAFDTALDDAQTKADGFTMPTQELQLEVEKFDKELAASQKSADGFKGPKADALTLEKSDFDSALKSAKEGSSEFKGVWDDLVVAVATAGITATIAGTLEFLGNAVDVYLNAGEKIDNASKNWKISAESYQEWSHVLSSSRADIKDFESGISTINKLLGGQEISEEATSAFEKLGVSATTASGRIKSTDEVLEDTINALSRYTENDRDTLTEAIFGKSSGNLNQMLDKGYSGIHSLIDEAHDLGIVMSDQQIENSVAYNTAMDNLQSVMTSFQTSLADSIVPGLTSVVESLTQIMTFFSGSNSGETGIQRTLKNVTAGLVGEAQEAETTADEAMGLVDQLWSLAGASEKTAEQQQIWKNVADELLKKIPELSEYINLDTQEITGNKEEIYNTITTWKEYQKQRALIAAQEEAGAAVEEKRTEYYKARADEIIAQNRESAESTSALKNMNEILKKYGVSEFSFSSDASSLGANLELRDFMQSAEYRNLKSQGTADDLVTEILAAKSDWDTASAQADEMSDKAETLKAELDEVEAGWEEYNNALIAAASESETAIDGTNTALDQTQTEATEATTQVNALSSALDELQGKSPVDIEVNGVTGISNQKGNWSVPYDNFPAILHRDEAVLTASQARKYREGADGGVDMSAFAQSMIAAVREGMTGATVDSYLDGKNVTGGVNRRTMNQLKARRFAT